MIGTEHFITCRPPATLQMKCTNSMIVSVWNRIGFMQTNRQNQSRGERDQNSDCLRWYGWEWLQVVWWKWRVCDRILPFPKFYNLTEREESYRRWKQCQKSSKKPRRMCGFIKVKTRSCLERERPISFRHVLRVQDWTLSTLHEV